MLRRGTVTVGPRYVFDRWVMDCARGILTDGHGPIPLRPKSFDVLAYLLKHAGQLVTRDDVISAVWPNVTVSEESLTQCVSEIRQALGSAGQSIIRTVPKRGYRVDVPVRQAMEREAEAASPAAVDSERWSPAPRAVLEEPSIAVLPFVNLSGDPGQDHLGDGMTEDVINGLSRCGSLAVIARNSSFSYRGRSVDVRRVGEELGVRYIVEGSVRRFGKRIRINARLADAASGIQRWAEQFDRGLGDIFAVQDEITRSIVAIVVAHLGNAEIERSMRKPPTSWTAYDLSLQGDQAMMRAEQLWDARYVYDARRLYAKALRISPDDARIRAKLAHTYVRAYADPTSPDLGRRGELEHGLELSRQAVGVAPGLPLAHAQLGWAKAWMKEPDEAIAAFEKAASLNPSFVDYRYPLILAFAGEQERALQAAQDCVRLDPFYGSMLPVIRGIALYSLERYDDALRALRETRGRAPHAPGQAVLAATLMRLGQRDEARTVTTELSKRLPHLSIGRWPMTSVFRRDRDCERFVEVLREAGLT
jgi:adenylate cyclase